MIEAQYSHSVIARPKSRGVGSGVVVLALIGCQHDAPTPLPAPQTVSSSVLFEAPDARCSDEPIGVLHSTDPGYLISADEVAARTMRDHDLDFRRCVLHRRQYVPDLGGKIVVTIRLDAAGKPSSVHTRGPEAELDRCVCVAVLALVFDLKSSTVTYPMFLTR